MFTRLRNWLHRSVPDTVKTRRHDKFQKALLDQHEYLGACPACGEKNRSVIYAVFTLKEETLDPKPDILRLVPIVCSSCGLAHLFDADSLNL